MSWYRLFVCGSPFFFSLVVRFLGDSVRGCVVFETRQLFKALRLGYSCEIGNVKKLLI
jgi:hypothetical protein